MFLDLVANLGAVPWLRGYFVILMDFRSTCLSTCGHFIRPFTVFGFSPDLRPHAARMRACLIIISNLILKLVLLCMKTEERSELTRPRPAAGATGTNRSPPASRGLYFSYLRASGMCLIYSTAPPERSSVYVLNTGSCFKYMLNVSSPVRRGGVLIPTMLQKAKKNVLRRRQRRYDAVWLVKSGISVKTLSRTMTAPPRHVTGKSPASCRR